MSASLHPEQFSSGDYSNAAKVIAALDAKATRHGTPCGAGSMVWRSWGSGTPVVLLHGGGGAWSHWIRNIETLAARYTVWAPDLPGLGDSASPAEFTVESIAEPVAQGLRTLLADAAFDLVTFSFGGPVGCYVASRPDLKVCNLVLTAARFVLEEGHTFPRLVRWKDMKSEAERMEAHRRNLELMMIADPARVDALAVATQSSNTINARFYGPPLKPGEKLHQYLPQVRVAGKIAGISGTRDHVAMNIMDQQQAALEAIHPGARFYPIAGAGHWVQYEAADTYNPLLLDLLSGAK